MEWGEPTLHPQGLFLLPLFQSRPLRGVPQVVPAEQPPWRETAWTLARVDPGELSWCFYFPIYTMEAKSIVRVCKQQRKQLVWSVPISTAISAH